MATGDISPAQRQVLTMLKRHGTATANEIATALEISSSAVRQHLAAMRSAGLVTSESRSTQRGQRGRPAETFQSTDQAESLFATSDTSLAIEVLDCAAEEDPALVARIFDRRQKAIVESVQSQIDESSPENRIAIAVDVLDEQGYLAESTTIAEGHHRIDLHSCAMWPVASKFGEACASELQLIQSIVPEASVERVATRTDGCHSCSYDLKI